MKKFFVICLALLTVGIAMSAGNPEKHYRKLIKRYDVADTVSRAPDAGSFWILLMTTHPTYHKIADSWAGKGDKDLKGRVESLMDQCSLYFTHVPVRSDLQPLADTVVARSGLRDINPLMYLTITKEEDVAAFSYPNGYVFMTQSVAELAGNDTTALLGLMAAEGTHFALQHVYAHLKWEKSNKRKERWARIGLAVGAVVLAATADAAIDNMRGNREVCDYDYDYRPTVTGSTLPGAWDLATERVEPRYTMIYMDDQVYESDIIAYRFMEWSGAGGRSYIDALRKVGFHIDANLNAEGEGPSMGERIALLEYLDANYRRR